jgi:hypothetical protein
MFLRVEARLNSHPLSEPTDWISTTLVSAQSGTWTTHHGWLILCSMFTLKFKS